MTFEELKKQIQNINIAYDKEFKVSNNGYSIDIRDDKCCYAIISSCVPYSVQTQHLSLRGLGENLRHDLLQAIFDFTQTPIDSRKLSPRFYISSKLTPKVDEKFLFKFGGSVNHLAWGVRDGGGTEFTQDEIDYIKKKFHTDLSDFNIDEVTE